MKYKIVAVSKNSDFKLNFDKINSIENVSYIQIKDNKKPLTTIYNEILDNIRKDRKNNIINEDFLILMHADVYLDIIKLFNHLNECSKKYDIFGLCGTSIVNVSQSPLNWWTSSNPTPTSKWGCVTHGELGNQKSFFNNHSPDVTDHEVACIDGLCIIFGKNALDSDLKFDEKFSFDIYDTDLCFQAILNYKLKLGVLVEDSLEHYSVGKSILTKEFIENEYIFRKKWNLDIPDKMKNILNINS